MSEFKRISAESAKQLLDQKSIAVVDIRDSQSFQVSHIPNSTHLDNNTLPRFIESTPIDKPVIVCCYHGNSSLSAAQFLADQGYQEVYSLDGGFEYWRTRFPVEE